jgi:outer membrane protein assembly factor BamD (BamD/ComL family)
VNVKRLLLVVFIMSTLAVSSCSGQKAGEMYETAQFEELQKNYVHAKELYREILEKYPESEYAPKASERLKALEAKE